jgi:hypothetical protein
LGNTTVTNEITQFKLVIRYCGIAQPQL